MFSFKIATALFTTWIMPHCITRRVAWCWLLFEIFAFHTPATSGCSSRPPSQLCSGKPLTYRDHIQTFICRSSSPCVDEKRLCDQRPCCCLGYWSSAEGALLREQASGTKFLCAALNYLAVTESRFPATKAKVTPLGIAGLVPEDNWDCLGGCVISRSRRILDWTQR